MCLVGEYESGSGPGGTQMVTCGLQTFMELEGRSCWPRADSPAEMQFYFVVALLGASGKDHQA